MSGRRALVIGAGPMGLEAALLAAERGWAVTVLERGAAVGDSLRRWGPTRFFTPFARNLSARGRALLGAAAPPQDALLTGPDFAEQVLRPLAASPPLAGRVHTGQRVIAVGRARMTRRDYAGHPLRSERPFRILAEGPNGEEHVYEAELVLDASGATRPNPAGAGGLPAIGERGASARILRGLGELHQRRDGLRGQRVLLVGHGHSAAHAVVELLAAGVAQLIWAVKSANKRPVAEVASDPLPERARVVSAANELAQHPPPSLEVWRRVQLERIDWAGGPLSVSLGAERRAEVDGIVALTGTRPEADFAADLALEIAPATEGAAGIARALLGVTDCLAAPSVSPGDLGSGEPGYYLIGQRAYGRLNSFLLESGRAQLEAIFAEVGR